MTEQGWIDLGRRAMACEGFEWPRGMRARHRRGAVGCALEVDDGLALFRADGAWGAAPAWVRLDGLIPDMTDPGTVGHIQAQMRSALASLTALGATVPHVVLSVGQLPRAGLVPSRAVTSYHVRVGMRAYPSAFTEAGAIVAAWETVVRP